MYYGPSPFYWIWQTKDSMDSTAGEFYYDPSLQKHFICCHVKPGYAINEDLQNFLTTYDNTNLLLIPKSKIQIYFNSQYMLPVLGDQVAYHVSVLKALREHVLSNLKSKQTFTLKRKLINYNCQNRKILKLINKITHFDENKDVVRTLCPFHDDHNPSANYNFKTQYFYCYACLKRCKNLFLHLKKINHPILNQLTV